MIRSTSVDIVRLPPVSEGMLLAVVALLSSTILLKVASIQYLEFIELGLLAYVLFRVLRTGGRIELSSGLFRLVVGYGALSLIILYGSGLAFTRPFYFKFDKLNMPGVITVARLLELLLGVFITVLLTEVFRRSQAKCLFTAKIYLWIGTLSAILSTLGIAVRGIFSVFTAGGRTSGFYNEGGPYGLYILSVLAVGIVLTHFEVGIKPQLLRTSIVINAIALLLSASKSAAVAVVLLMAIEVLYAGSLRQKLISFSVAAVLLTLLIALTPVSRGVAAYIDGGRKFEAISQLRPGDVNFTYGRVAALFFVPRMIEQHPLTGVGFGNYGFVRNAPEYRGNAAPAVLFLDHDGLGLAGVAAEIGLPGLALLLYLLVQPVRLARHLTHSRAILAAACLQPVVHLCGAQLNVTYPWVVSALVLGLASMPEFARDFQPRKQIVLET